MGLALHPAQDDADADSVASEARRTRRPDQQSYLVGCCYTPRKHAYRRISDPSGFRLPPRYRVLAIPQPEQPIESDSDSGPETHGGGKPGKKRVHWSSQRLVTVHEMVEDGDDYRAARQSDDVRLEDLPEKIANVRKIGDPRYRPSLSATLEPSAALQRRAAARSRRRANGIPEAAEHQNFVPPSRIGHCWTSKELEVWNPEHIKEVIKELFQKHDVKQKGYLSWEEQEVMPFVEDFFQAHGCAMPDLPTAVFSTAYHKVTMDTTQQNTGGLNVDQMCDFAKRVYDHILKDMAAGRSSDALPQNQTTPQWGGGPLAHLPRRRSSDFAVNGPAVSQRGEVFYQEASRVDDEVVEL